MISKITVKSKATYSDVGIELNPKKINFIYGSNGSGKTTISRQLAKKEGIVWDNSIEMPVEVYNEDFKNNVLRPDNEVDGIFTLGGDEAKVQKDIENKKVLLDANGKEIINAKRTKDDLDTKFANDDISFRNTCWGAYKRMEVFCDRFVGKKETKKFANQIEQTYSQWVEGTEVKKLEELVSKQSIIYGADRTKTPSFEIPKCDIFDSLENEKILQDVIIGKADVKIAKLIQSLNSSDWVKQGAEYLKKSNDVCPFCQQSIDGNELKHQIEEYFDVSFTDSIAALQIFKNDYVQAYDNLIGVLNAIIEVHNKFIDVPTISSYVSSLNTICKANMAVIEDKLNNPSKKITLETVHAITEKVSKYLSEALEKTKRYNKTIDNIKIEESEFIKDMWNYILVREIGLDIVKNFQQQKASCEKGTNGILVKIANLEKRTREIQEEIGNLESSVTSVIPTVEKINKVLKAYGFTSFSLESASEKKGFYKIKRADGSDARNTLSEGERTFITFLYYDSLLNGSKSSTGTKENKIAVIDDPISSLDANILFVVSKLIRNRIDTVQDNNASHIKQMFIMSHNAYFLKEVSFKMDQGPFFGLIFKDHNGCSQLKPYENNPIKSSYEMLWEEVRASDINKISLFNAMRRILEMYFKHFGNIKNEDILKCFEGEEQIICSALIACINDGSHDVYDDLCVGLDADCINKYKSIFKMIFERTNHLAHYNMMMRVEDNSLPEGSVTTVISQTPALVMAK